MAQVTLRNVSKSYGGVRAVDNVSVEIADGEFLVLVGPSGCGKTTTLRLVAGLEACDAGTISIDDVDVTLRAPKDRDVAMVFQNYALWPHMTIRQNLSFGLRLRNNLTPGRLLAARVFRPTRHGQMTGKLHEIDRLVEQTADMLGIADLLERKPAALSGGQQQRAAVGRALVRRPKVFLFDEPLSNLDAVLRVELRRELRRLHDRLQATMIYVTHDQTEAMTLGTRIAVMDGGRVRQLGEPLEIYERPVDRFVAGFIGSPPMNFLAGVLRKEEQGLVLHGDWDLPLGPLAARDGLSDGRNVVLGIRPEHVRLSTATEPSIAISGTVGLVEPLGYETIVHVSFGRANLTAKAAPHDAPEPGIVVTVHLLTDRIHWFDAEKGSRI